MASPRAGETASLIDEKPTTIPAKDLPFGNRVARVLVSGHVPYKLNADAPTPIATTPTWTDVTLHPVVLTTPQGFEVASSSGNDTGGGSGATEVTIWGLPDDKGQVASVHQPPYQSETLALAGIAWRGTALSYAAIQGVRVSARGVTGYNEGDIDIRAADTTLYHRIEATRGDGREDRLVIPFGWSGALSKVWVWWTGAQAANWRLREDTGDGARRTLWDGQIVASNSGTGIEFDLPLPLNGGNTYWFQAQRTGGVPGETIRIEAEGYLFVTVTGGVPDSLPPSP